MKLLALTIPCVIAASFAKADIPCWQTPDDHPYTEISEEEALAASDGTVLLHFGKDFPDHVLEAVALLVDEHGFRNCIFVGGPPEQMELYIDGQRGKKPFPPADTIGILLSVLQEHAGHLRGLD
jgi:hypothetical protein